MKNAPLLISILLVFSSALHAQDSIYSNFDQPEKVVRLHIIAPGVTIEKSSGINRTFLFDATLGFSYSYSNVNGHVSSSGDVIPQVRIEWRRYTTLEKRRILHKRTDNYSSAYWAWQVAGGYSIANELPLIQTGGLWGFQTSFARNAYVDINLGIGLGTDTEYIFILPLGNLSLGWIIQ